MEADSEKLHEDLSQCESLNKGMKEKINMLEEELRESSYEHQKLKETLHNLESEIKVLHVEMDKKSKTSEESELLASAEQKNMCLIKSKESELESIFNAERQDFLNKIEKLELQLDSHTATIEDLQSTIEGLEMNAEHSKNIIDMKNSELKKKSCEIEQMQKDREMQEEIRQQLCDQNTEKLKQIEEITGLLKIKCDMLSEYKTKVEIMKPENENLREQIRDRKLCIEKCKEDINNLKLEQKKEIDAILYKL